MLICSYLLSRLHCCGARCASKPRSQANRDPCQLPTATRTCPQPAPAGPARVLASSPPPGALFRAPHGHKPTLNPSGTNPRPHLDSEIPTLARLRTARLCTARLCGPQVGRQRRGRRLRPPPERTASSACSSSPRISVCCFLRRPSARMLGSLT